MATLFEKEFLMFGEMQNPPFAITDSDSNSCDKVQFDGRNFW
jgi:hypothetical protein